MRLARLIPVCLISVMMGVLLPRLFVNPTHLLFAAAGYMALMWTIDKVFGSSQTAERE